MASPMDRGFAQLNRAMQQSAAFSATCKRAGVLIGDAIPVLLSAPLVEVATTGNATVVGRQYKLQIKRQSYVLSGNPTDPIRDDVISFTLNGKTLSCTILPAQGTPEVGNVDPRSDWIPVQVKLMSVA